MISSVGSLENIAVHCILQLIAGVIHKAKRFCRFINYVIWISASETPNESIQQTLISAFAHIGLELKLPYVLFFKSKMCSDFTKKRQICLPLPFEIFLNTSYGFQHNFE